MKRGLHRNRPRRSPIGWAFEAARWTADDRTRVKAGAPAEAEPPASQLARTCTERGLSRPRPLAMPDAAYLPLVCRTDSRGWGVVVGRTPAGLWVTRYDSGEVRVTALALHNACFAAADAQPEAVPCASREPTRLPLFSAMACIPGLEMPAWQNVSAALVSVLALFLAVQLIRWLGRRSVRRRKPALSAWAEELRFARQRDRIVRQAIRSGAPCAGYPAASGSRDPSRSI